jgi:hypothetical protein
MLRPSLDISLNRNSRGTTLESEWEEVGPASDRRLRLSSIWNIGTALFHVSAFRVIRDDEGTQEVYVQDAGTDDDLDQIADILDEFEDFDRLIGPNGGFETVKIDGSDYALFIYPFSA